MLVKQVRSFLVDLSSVLKGISYMLVICGFCFNIRSVISLGFWFFIVLIRRPKLLFKAGLSIVVSLIIEPG